MRTKRRPEYHVTPWQNWCNDPNGLLFHNGKYHAFYQHYPHAHHWGPMHWGHAISDDLYRWEHAPIALFPDELGYCYSGSAVFDKNNTSGLGTADQPPYILIYTSHPAVDPKDGPSYEMQSIAYSLDGIRFTPYEGNPIIPNNGKPDFRDPKVFWYEPNQNWVAVLAAGDHIAFYVSKDLIHWEYSGDFGPGENTISGVWECPDMFALEFEGKEYWILIVSMGTSIDSGRSITQYFIGDFDGNKFTSKQIAPASRLIDEGPDNYAAVGFSGTETPCIMGWAVNWEYSADTPTEGYVAQMTSPRDLSLYLDKEGRLALASLPVAIPEDAIQSKVNFSEKHMLGKSMNVLRFCPDKNNHAFRLTMQNIYGEQVVLTQDKDRNLILDRTESGDMSYHPCLAGELYQKRSLAARTDVSGEFLVILDGPLLEVYADEGSRVLTMVVYPSSPYTEVFTEGLAEVELSMMKPYDAPMPAEPYLNQNQ